MSRSSLRSQRMASTTYVSVACVPPGKTQTYVVASCHKCCAAPRARHFVVDHDHRLRSPDLVRVGHNPFSLPHSSLLLPVLASTAYPPPSVRLSPPSDTGTRPGSPGCRRRPQQAQGPAEGDSLLPAALHGCPSILKHGCVGRRLYALATA